MWAVVLVPMWLRKHDENNESRSVDRFSRALGSLSSRLDRGDRHDGADTVVIAARGKVPAGRAVLMPGRPAGAQDHQVTVFGSARATGARPRRAVGPATRRRRLIVGSLLVTLLVLVAGLLHRVPLWAAAVPALITMGLLVTARRQVARTAEMGRRRARRTVLSEAARLAEAERLRAARAGAARVDAGAARSDVAAEPAFASPAPPAVADSWDAVPTTLPTYVTAPAATRVPRVIDRTTPGSWSGAAMLDQARSTRHEEPADDSGMRVESFEISVPRERERPAAPTYAERYLDTDAGTAELAATDDEAALAALLDDDRSGVTARRSSYGRRAAG